MDSAASSISITSRDPKGDEETNSYHSRTKVDSVHPRFLLPKELPPVSSGASTDDYFCEQCKMMFLGTVDGIRRHFCSVPHSACASCRYCGGDVYEYVEGDHRKLAHDCSPVKNVKRI